MIYNTRRLLVIAFLALLVLLTAWVTLFESWSTAEVSTTSTISTDAIETIGVVEPEAVDKTEYRDALKTKLAERTVQADVSETVVEEEGEATATEVVAGAVAIGDGKVATEPRSGYVYSCQLAFGGVGAHAVGDWVSDGYWFPEKKLAVSGSRSWEHSLTIESAEGARLVSGNGLPSHSTGVYPIAATDPAYQFDRNPNAILEQSITLQLPLMPSVATAPRCVPMGMVGVALSGAAIFNGLDATGRDAAAHEVLDACGGHPEQSGEYHYHNESDCLVAGVYEGAQSTLLGYALDGFGIYASLERGAVLTNEDLDVCHGHTHTIPWNGSLIDMYHYHMTKEYPYTVGCFMGEPTSVQSVPVAGLSTDAPPRMDTPPPPKEDAPLTTS